MPKPQRTSRSIINDDSEIVDTRNKIPAVPARSAGVTTRCGAPKVLSEPTAIASAEGEG
jgi:hypothetical protein